MKYLLPLLVVLGITSCVEEPYVPIKGTSFTMVNNTFGVNDFVVAEVGTYPIRFGSIDFGRNLSRLEDDLNYNDSIGYITFDADGTGVFEIRNQDSLKTHCRFFYTFQKSKGEWWVNIDFDKAMVKTYVTSEPLRSFDYSQVRDNLWVYTTSMHLLSGYYKWQGNKLILQ